MIIYHLGMILLDRVGPFGMEISMDLGADSGVEGLVHQIGAYLQQPLDMTKKLLLENGPFIVDLPSENGDCSKYPELFGFTRG